MGGRGEKKVKNHWSRPFVKLKKNNVSRPRLYAALDCKPHEMMKKLCKPQLTIE